MKKLVCVLNSFAAMAVLAEVTSRVEAIRSEYFGAECSDELYMTVRHAQWFNQLPLDGSEWNITIEVTNDGRYSRPYHAGIRNMSLLCELCGDGLNFTDANGKVIIMRIERDFENWFEQECSSSGYWDILENLRDAFFQVPSFDWSDCRFIARQSSKYWF